MKHDRVSQLSWGNSPRTYHEFPKKFFAIRATLVFALLRRLHTIIIMIIIILIIIIIINIFIVIFSYDLFLKRTTWFDGETNFPSKRPITVTPIAKSYRKNNSKWFFIYYFYTPFEIRTRHRFINNILLSPGQTSLANWIVVDNKTISEFKREAQGFFTRYTDISQRPLKHGATVIHGHISCLK